MTKTYTPLTIEGKIYVVEDAPEKPNGTKPFDSLAYEIEMRYFDLDLAACTKYETLPEHAPYWKERIGQRLGESDFRYAHGLSGMDHITYAIPPNNSKPETSIIWDGVYMGACPNCNKYPFVSGCKTESGSYHASQFCQCSDPAYAIPPQQKQGDDELWDALATSIDDIARCPLVAKRLLMNKTLIKNLRDQVNLTKK